MAMNGVMAAASTHFLCSIPIVVRGNSIGENSLRARIRSKWSARKSHWPLQFGSLKIWIDFVHFANNCRFAHIPSDDEKKNVFFFANKNVNTIGVRCVLWQRTWLQLLIRLILFATKEKSKSLTDTKKTQIISDSEWFLWQNRCHSIEITWTDSSCVRCKNLQTMRWCRRVLFAIARTRRHFRIATTPDSIIRMAVEICLEPILFGWIVWCARGVDMSIHTTGCVTTATNERTSHSSSPFVTTNSMKRESDPPPPSLPAVCLCTS